MKKVITLLALVLIVQGTNQAYSQTEGQEGAYTLKYMDKERSMDNYREIEFGKLQWSVIEQGRELIMRTISPEGEVLDRSSYLILEMKAEDSRWVVFSVKGGDNMFDIIFFIGGEKLVVYDSRGPVHMEYSGNIEY